MQIFGRRWFPAIAYIDSLITVYLSERAPVIHNRLPAEETLGEGEGLTLHCHTSGSPTPIIKWLKDRLPLDTKDTRIHIAPTG